MRVHYWNALRSHEAAHLCGDGKSVRNDGSCCKRHWPSVTCKNCLRASQRRGKL